VFDVVGVDPQMLDGGLCRYLKPIRRVRDAPDGEVPPWHGDSAREEPNGNGNSKDLRVAPKGD
ncbi:MAG: hypothetical protein VB934_13760, partial [Polyangiaceae bacterium]